MTATVGEAMAHAQAAHEKIESHEALCAERYEHIHSKLDDVKGTVGTVLKLLAGGLSLLFTILIGLVAFFGSRTFDNNDSDVQQLREQIQQMQKAEVRGQQVPNLALEVRHSAALTR